MPELPEVETTRRGIQPHAEKKIITAVVIREHRLRWPVPSNLPTLLANKKIIGIHRRAKYLLLRCGNGHLIIHLGMSGSLRLCSKKETLLKHDHVLLHLNSGLTLRFNDPRRFGCVLWTDEPVSEHTLLRHLGPEPLGDDFSGEHLFTKSRKRTSAVKNFIMDNRIVVGVGNIYANEALFLSGIRPRKAAGSISQKKFEMLHANIVKALSNAIEMGGTTLRNFVGGDGKPGYFQQTLNVYGKVDEPCPKCKTKIKQVTVGQRSSFYCPLCQQ